MNYVAAHGEDYEHARQMTVSDLQAWQPKSEAPQPDPEDEAQTVQIGSKGPKDPPTDRVELPVELLESLPRAMNIEQYELLNPPSVHESWCRVMESVRSVAKGDYNKDQRFHFRGIDAVLDAVGPALRKHTVHIRPRRILEHSVTEYTSKAGSRMVNRLVKVEWEVTGPRGDSFMGESMGEAADSSDKSMSKAQSVAYRIFLLQSLAIPTGDDPDFESHERATPSERQQAVRQAQSSGSYRSREEWERAQAAAQAKAGEENQDRWPDATNNDPWTGKPDEAQQDSTVGKPDTPPRENPKADADNRPMSQPSRPMSQPEARKEMWRVARDLGWEWAALSRRFQSDYGIETAAATTEQLEEFKQAIIIESDEMERAKSLVQNELGGREVNPSGGQLL